MDYQSRLDELNEKLRNARLSWGRSDYITLTGKGTKHGRLLGALTRGYYQRERLWQSGQIIYGYLYKTYTDVGFSRPYLAWIIFSPLSSFETDPSQYEAIMIKLQQLIDKEKPDRHERKLYNALTNPVTEPKYFPLPEAYSEGRLVYVSTTFVYPDLTEQAKFGIIPIIIAPAITKEIMCVPDMIL